MLALAVAGSPSVRPAHAAGGAAAGRALADAWCTGCHAGDARGTDLAPPLGTIASRPDRSETYLYAWLSDPHPPMPQLKLSRREIADLIAYLATLRRP